MQLDDKKVTLHTCCNGRDAVAPSKADVGGAAALEAQRLVTSPCHQHRAATVGMVANKSGVRDVDNPCCTDAGVGINDGVTVDADGPPSATPCSLE